MDTLATPKARCKDTGHAVGNGDRWSESLWRVTLILVDPRIAGLFAPFFTLIRERQATRMVRQYTDYPGILSGALMRHASIDDEVHTFHACTLRLKRAPETGGLRWHHAVMNKSLPSMTPCADGSRVF